MWFHLLASLKYIVNSFYLVQIKANFILHYYSWFCHETCWQPILKVLLEHLHYNFYREWCKKTKGSESDEARWTFIFKAFNIRANWFDRSFLPVDRRPVLTEDSLSDWDAPGCMMPAFSRFPESRTISLWCSFCTTSKCILYHQCYSLSIAAT